MPSKLQSCIGPANIGTIILYATNTSTITSLLLNCALLSIEYGYLLSIIVQRGPQILDRSSINPNNIYLFTTHLATMYQS